MYQKNLIVFLILSLLVLVQPKGHTNATNLPLNTTIHSQATTEAQKITTPKNLQKFQPEEPKAVSESITSFFTQLNASITPPLSIFPLRLIEVIGIIILVLVGGLANSTGNGGGAVLTSILLIFFPYSANTASQVVYSLIFGGCLGNFINLVRKRDPKSKLPVISYDIANVCMPSMLFGSSIGLLFNRMLSQAVIVIGMIVISTLASTKLYAKTKSQYKLETKELLLTKERAASNASTATESEDDEIVMLIHCQNDPLRADPEIKSIMELDQRLFPVMKYVNVLLLMCSVMVIALFRGTSKFHSVVGLEYCQTGYWGMFLLTLIVCGVFLLYNKRSVKANILMKTLLSEQKKVSPKAIDPTFHLSYKKVQTLYLLCTLAGFLAGLLGMGGGTVLNPALLSVGIAPRTVIATSGFMVMLTSFVSLFQSLLYQDAPLQDEIFFFVLTIIGSFVVSSALNWVVKMKNRPSILLIAFLAVLAISVPATPIYVMWKNWNDLSKLIKFGSAC